MKSIEKRNSSIELLRILMILLIVFHHFCYHGVEERIDIFSQGLSINRTIVEFLHFGGIVANNVFAIITGYFLIEKFDDNLVKIKHIIILFCGYITFINLVLFIVTRTSIFAIKDFIYSELSVLTGGNWFINCYIILMLVSPFINMGIKHLSRKQYDNLLVILFAIGYILPCIMVYTGINTNCSFSGMVIMYLIGGYIRKYGFTFCNNRIEKRCLTTLTIFLLTVVFASLFVSNLFIDRIGILYRIPSILMNHMFSLCGGGITYRNIFFI